MAADWAGKCHNCNKWRLMHDTHKKAMARDEEGNLTNFVRACSFCSTPIQRKCCANGCPHCGGTGMHPIPQPPLTHQDRAEILLELQQEEANNWHSEQMQILYGKDYR